MGRKRMIFGSEMVAITIAIATLLVLKESSAFFDQSLWEPCPPKDPNGEVNRRLYGSIKSYAAQSERPLGIPKEDGSRNGSDRGKFGVALGAFGTADRLRWLTLGWAGVPFDLSIHGPPANLSIPAGGLLSWNALLPRALKARNGLVPDP
jgi:hypothetical protein